MANSLLFCGIALLTMVSVSSLRSGGGDPRPDIDKVPEFARWLVRRAKFGTLAIVQMVEVPEPFGYIASYSDGGTGSPYFYLSSLDPAGAYASTNTALACLTISEVFINGCGGVDPQSPGCAKLRMLPGDSDEGGMAEGALFRDHPAFARFPRQNGTFAVYKLDIERIFLVNKAAPARDLTVDDYFDA
ncbi:uncharacterized protein LOC131001194 isoform X2 [Salvia miltiorrhiza]|uniref:uncharacterized protein LOC131001194 isoform X2 n=1 Tax=Salvia miltiorrhiza TaxID=226208 RepID=UPI0025AC903F|nr:uncharacterized protein LOC131001194 isoform X2 [Salvia miltiorrhiza]